MRRYVLSRFVIETATSRDMRKFNLVRGMFLNCSFIVGRLFYITVGVLGRTDYLLFPAQ